MDNMEVGEYSANDRMPLFPKIKEDFSWLNDCENRDDEVAFVYVNENRRTIQPGEQVFYNYRNRSNENLLLFFSFCFPGNEYNSLLLHLRNEPLLAGSLQD